MLKPKKMSKSEAKVPWEPYRAATNSAAKKPLLSSKSSSAMFGDEEPSFDKENLVRYKIDTDLSLFNAERPGYQFDECDFQLTDKPSAGEFKSPPEFVDARFYTDFHFLKLANEMKKKCIESAKSPVLAAASNKPVNVVGPLIEKKPPLATAASSHADNNAHMRIWKAQLSKYESRVEYLENQMRGMYEQLQIQTQVNAELKKLLVAAIGEDMQYKLERLVNDKQRYEHELANNAKEIERMSEEVEQISIRCDLWRSKFLACKVMNDETSTWKAFLLLLNRQNEAVMRNLLADNELLNDKLNQALDLLSEIKSGNTSETTHRPDRRNLNNLLAANTLIASLTALKKSQAKTNSTNFESASPSGNGHVRHHTMNESIGAQMLEQFDWLKLAIPATSANRPEDENSHVVDSFEKLEQLLNRVKISRSTVHSRLYQSTDISVDLLINVCNRCTGQIKVV